MVDGFPRIQLQPRWPLSDSQGLAQSLVRRAQIEFENIHMYGETVPSVVSSGGAEINRLSVAILRAVAHEIAQQIPQIAIVPMPTDDDLKHADIQVLERIFSAIGGELAARKQASETGDKR